MTLESVVHGTPLGDTLCRKCNRPIKDHSEHHPNACSKSKMEITLGHPVFDLKDDHAAVTSPHRMKWGDTICDYCGMTAMQHTITTRSEENDDPPPSLVELMGEDRLSRFQYRIERRRTIDGTRDHCDICQGSGHGQLMAAPIIPHEYEEGLIAKWTRTIDWSNGVINGYPESTTDVRNGLWVCFNCAQGLEDHEINIQTDGTIQIQEQFMTSLTDPNQPEIGQIYRSLNGIRVIWSDLIGRSQFHVTRELLKWRLILPPPKSTAGRLLTREWEAATDARQNGEIEDDYEPELETEPPVVSTTVATTKKRKESTKSTKSKRAKKTKTKS